MLWSRSSQMQIGFSFKKSRLTMATQNPLLLGMARVILAPVIVVTALQFTGHSQLEPTHPSIEPVAAKDSLFYQSTLVHWHRGGQGCFIATLTSQSMMYLKAVSRRPSRSPTSYNVFTMGNWGGGCLGHDSKNRSFIDIILGPDSAHNGWDTFCFEPPLVIHVLFRGGIDKLCCLWLRYYW